MPVKRRRAKVISRKKHEKPNRSPLPLMILVGIIIGIGIALFINRAETPEQFLVDRPSLKRLSSQSVGGDNVVSPACNNLPIRVIAHRRGCPNGFKYAYIRCPGGVRNDLTIPVCMTKGEIENKARTICDALCASPNPEDVPTDELQEPEPDSDIDSSNEEDTDMEDPSKENQSQDETAEETSIETSEDVSDPLDF